MANTKKLIQAAAGAAGGAALNVEEVFSTYLYEGESFGTTNTIVNGIDLSGEGGLLWIKSRGSGGSDTYGHYLFDTERGANKYLYSQNSNAEDSQPFGIQFNSDGWQSGGGYDAISNNNTSFGSPYASWTFRKAPKFFDVVTYTGTGSPRTIAHSLGVEPGCIIVKAVSGAALGGVSDWTVYHRGVDATNPEQYRLYLNTTGARVDQTNPWNDTAPTSTVFTVGTDSYLNANGDTYVAYLFAHNDGDGDFGSTADQDIIKCGSYTGNGSTNGPEINLGFEPQWVMIKGTDVAEAWTMFDTMRGIPNGSNSLILRANDSGAELDDEYKLNLTPTGFKVTSSLGHTNNNNQTYIYIAIRRGPMAVPESATDVFQVGTVQNNTPKDVSPAPDFPVDFVLHHAAANSSTGNKLAINRLANDLLYTNLTGGSNTYGTYSSYSPFDHMDNVQLTGLGAANGAAWMWKRAPNYFDVVAYTGNNSSNNHHAINHNLGVAPEMIWFKRRDSTGGWGVLVTALGTVDSGGVQVGQGAYLNETGAFAASGWWGSPYVAPTATEFTVRTATPNASGGDYIAYLFASVDGVSKVGSYTGNGSTQNIDCGFSSGARFVLIKRSSGVQSWYLFDSERGITSLDDKALLLNTTDAEDTWSSGATDINPYSAGFTLDGNGVGSNENGETYIFYAIA